VELVRHQPEASWRHCLHQTLCERLQTFEAHVVKNKERKGILQHTFFSKACMQHKGLLCLRLSQELDHRNASFPFEKMLLPLLSPLLSHLIYLWEKYKNCMLKPWVCKEITIHILGGVKASCPQHHHQKPKTLLKLWYEWYATNFSSWKQENWCLFF